MLGAFPRYWEVRMLEHGTRRATGRWRRLAFVVWIALTIVFAAYIAITAPFTSYFYEDMWLVSVVVPPLMILLLGIGLLWLVWLVTSSRRSDG
jgi:hypothetical protein